MLSAGEGLQIAIDLASRLIGSGMSPITQAIGNGLGQILVDIQQVRNHADADIHLVNFNSVQDEGIGDVLLLHGCLADIKLTRL